MNGAYHATPWGKHVNEGIAEWPPSPWRFLRAIISVWKIKHPALKEGQIKPIIEKLAGEDPVYQLPDASVSHTKHYMPDDKTRSLVLDTFIVTGKKPTYIVWKDLILDDGEKKHLKKLLSGLHYFGRSESWCKAELKDGQYDIVNYKADQKQSTGDKNLEQIVINSRPLDEDLDEGEEIVRVLLPGKKVDLTDLHTGKPTASSMTVTTAILQDKRAPYTDPPGARWVRYVRPRNFFQKSLSPKTDVSMLNDITLVRYAVVGTIRPSIKDIMRIGDIARNACLSRHSRETGNRSSVFLGKDENGKPLENHRHAFYLSTYETQKRDIDHLTIIATGGFGQTELTTLLQLKKIYRYNGVGARLVFQGFGTINDFPDIPILKKSKKWVTATPLILSRHIKRKKDRIVDGPEEQVRNEIRKRYGFELEKIDIRQSRTGINGTSIKPLEFFRWRRHGNVGTGDPYVVELEFKNLVNGPITLGYGSHFGLGMFVSENGK